MKKKILVIILLIIIFIGYFKSVGRYLIPEGDTIEFIVAGYTNGIPHSSGYPLYVRLLNTILKRLTFNNFTIAFKVYFFNILLGILSVFLLYLIIENLCSDFSGFKNILIIFLSIAWFAFGTTYWKQVISGEVYVLHILTIEILLYLMLKNINLFILGLILGLGLSNHITIIFMLPVIIFYNWKKITVKNIVIFFIGLSIGLLPYFDMMYRARKNPILNLQHPDTIKKVLDVVTMQQYNHLKKAPFFNKAKIDYIKNNFYKELNIIQIIFAFIGGLFLFKKTKTFWLLLLTLVSFSVSILIYRQLSYNLVYDTIYVFYLPLYLIITIFAAIGIINIIEFSMRKPIIAYCLLLLFFILQLQIYFSRYIFVNNKHNNLYEIYFQDLVNELPENAVILTDSDNLFYMSWYYQIVLNKYKDKLFLHKSLFKENWYYKDLNRISENNLLKEYIIKKKITNNMKKKLYILAGKELKIKRYPFGLTDRDYFNNNENEIKKYSIKTRRNWRNYINQKWVRMILTNYARAYTVLGIKYAKKDNVRKATEMFSTALNIRPGFSDAIFNFNIMRKKNKKKLEK